MCHGKETKTIVEGASLMALAQVQQKGCKVKPFPKAQGASWCWRRGNHCICCCGTESPTSCSDLLELWLCKPASKPRENKMSFMPLVSLSLQSYILPYFLLELLAFHLNFKCFSRSLNQLRRSLIRDSLCFISHRLVVCQFCRLFFSWSPKVSEGDQCLLYATSNTSDKMLLQYINPNALVSYVWVCKFEIPTHQLASKSRCTPPIFYYNTRTYIQIVIRSKEWKFCRSFLIKM